MKSRGEGSTRPWQALAAAIALLASSHLAARAADANGWVCGAFDQTAKRGRLPQPDPTGRVYPIVTVHGITGSDQDFDNIIDKSYIDANPKPPRSLLDLLAGSKEPGQRVPPGLDGVAVYSFSYTPDSLRWVGDPKVGLKFAATIDCLYERWKTPVSVVAHSMGGLVTRWVANTTDEQGVQRGSKLGKIITLGTPYTGSDLAAVINGVTDSLGPLVSLIGYLCGELGTATGDADCAGVPLIAALKSEAGRALSSGSRELDELKPWPRGTDVRTIAGSIQVPIMLLGSPLNAPAGFGDLIVSTSSATADPKAGRVFQCRYDSAGGSLATQLKRILQLATPAERHAQLGRLLLGSPCYHSLLMRSVELTNDVIGELNDWLSARRVPTCADPSPEAEWLGRTLKERFKGFDRWADAPDFAAVARPLVDRLQPCGPVFATSVISKLNVVGPTWRLMTGWIDDWPLLQTGPPASSTVKAIEAWLQRVLSYRLLGSCDQDFDAADFRPENTCIVHVGQDSRGEIFYLGQIGTDNIFFRIWVAQRGGDWAVVRATAT